MVTQVFKSNASEHAEIILAGVDFQEDVFFPKIRNVNRLKPEHRGLIFRRTEKYDGQQIGVQRRGNYLVFYSRNGILDLQSLGKGINKVWAETNWDGIAAVLEESDTLYFEAVGNHKDFDYRDGFVDGYGFIAFALRKAGGRILDPSLLPDLSIPKVVVKEIGGIPDLEMLRGLLATGREGYVFTGYTNDGEYVAYKAKRRELLEEAIDEEYNKILTGNDFPEVKIAKIVCTTAKVKHILQKFSDGEFAVRGSGIGEDGRWDGSNAIIPTLIKVVQDDCWAEAGETIRELCAKLNVKGKQVNGALQDRVRTTFFDLTLRESLR